MVRDKRPSEFGGRPGLIQDAPHEPTPTETLMQVYALEPAPIPGEEPPVPPDTKRIKK